MNGKPCLFALATGYSAGFQAGYFVSLMITCLLMSGPALYYFLTWRKRGTNAKSVLSLAILLSAFLTAALTGLALRNHPGIRWLSGFVGILLFAGVIVAVVLAILGLWEFRRRRGRFNRGKFQAYTTLVLSLAFFCLVLPGICRGLIRARQKAEAAAMQQTEQGK